MASSMFSTIRRYTSRHRAVNDSPSPAARKISFREDEERAGRGLGRPFLQPRYRDDPPESDESNDDDPSDSQNSGEEMDEDDDAVEEENEGDDEDDEDQNEADEDTPLLPIFSSAHLDTISVYTLTHVFRMLVISRCDTTLSWEQLRSPQVSQFLVKPIQEEIKANHLNAATEYALLANCLQFTKEASMNPGNSGNNKTRAMICELIAIKMLREYTTRQLIDALSYDFDPLQGQAEADASLMPALPSLRRSAVRPARISCLEIALRAQSKRFLAHPVIVQHLEAIWNGSIVFHAAADSMHRRRSFKKQPNSYGTSGEGRSPQSTRFEKTVTLYNPRDASLFKLSRLRVPRYRNIFSTVSFAVLLGLFLAVLKEKSLPITSLEVVFWAWAAGYMLDEVLGFNDQGFSLYIASFWNTFDLGILLLLFIHLCLRLAGLVMFDDESTAIMAKRAYDVLALSAVLLFPRLFSVLDHYRYFSQLIIAFRMMAADMLAIFLLIVVFCSGFLVALTLAFANGNNGTDDPWDVAYALLQMVLGFTPAAWDRWDDYNWLGRITLISFLFICHFVVVTILIMVMTNSFMEIVRNANEEHQYLFAVNTISNVKSDALFAYVPPGNVLQWSLTPLRYLLPFRTYIKVNRYIIKVTHFPILFTIYVYENFILQRRFVDSVDFLELKKRPRKTFTQHLPRLIRAPSIATFRQDAALAEVFKLPGDTALRSAQTKEARKASNVVNTWMTGLGDEEAEPPEEDDRRLVDRLEHRRRPGQRRMLSARARDFSRSGRAMSVLSDPNDFASHMEDFLSPRGRQLTPLQTTPSALELPPASTDADGDDELLTNESETNIDRYEATSSRSIKRSANASQSEYFVRGRGTRDQSLDFVGRADPMVRRSQPQSRTISRQSPLPSRPPERRPETHLRNASFATMVYDPLVDQPDELQQPPVKEVETKKRASVDVSTTSEGHTPASKLSANAPGRKTPRKQPPSRARPALPGQDNTAFRSTPDIHTVLRNVKSRGVSPNKGRKPLEMDIVSDIGDNKALGGGFVGAIPASFAAQMRKSQEQQQQQNENSEMFGRMVMARMNTLEEGFREIIHEVREATRQAGSRQRSPERPSINVHRASRDRITRKERPISSSNINSNAVSSAVSSAGGNEARPNTAVKLQHLGDIEQKLRADLEFVASIRQIDVAEDPSYRPVEPIEQIPEHTPAPTNAVSSGQADRAQTSSHNDVGDSGDS